MILGKAIANKKHVLEYKELGHLEILDSELKVSLTIQASFNSCDRSKAHPIDIHGDALTF